MNPTETLPLTDRLALTLDGLCQVVAARIAPGIAGWAMQVFMIVLVWGRVRRIKGTIQKLLVRFQAGRLWTQAVPRSGGGGGGARKPSASAGLPRRFAWLVPMVPYQAATFAGHLRLVLADPEMQALLAASAQARRVLAPLCRMLGVEAALLSPGDVVEPAEEVAAPRRVRAARARVAGVGPAAVPVGWVGGVPRWCSPGAG